MALQTTVRFSQATGVIGDVIFDGPMRAYPVILASADAANNVVGRAFTRAAGDDKDVTAGGTGVFAGILINSKELALYGTAAGGTLAPTLTLPNEMAVSVMDMGFVVVTLSTDAAIGDDVCYVDATGALFAVDPGAAAGTGNTKIPNANVAYFNTSAAGLAVIRLTN